MPEFYFSLRQGLALSATCSLGVPAGCLYPVRGHRPPRSPSTPAPCSERHSTRLPLPLTYRIKQSGEQGRRVSRPRNTPPRLQCATDYALPRGRTGRSCHKGLGPSHRGVFPHIAGRSVLGPPEPLRPRGVFFISFLARRFRTLLEPGPSPNAGGAQETRDREGSRYHHFVPRTRPSQNPHSKARCRALRHSQVGKLRHGAATALDAPTGDQSVTAGGTR